MFQFEAVRLTFNATENGRAEAEHLFKALHISEYTEINNTAYVVYLRRCLCVQLCEAEIPTEKVEPKVHVFYPRVEFVGSSKTNNISILLWNITFEDEGEYICFARNPKEKNRNHSAIFTLIVVDQSMWQMCWQPGTMCILVIAVH